MNDYKDLIPKIRRHGAVLVRFVPPLKYSDVYYLLRVSAIHELVDLWQPAGADQDWSLVDRAQWEWEGLLVDAVPVLCVNALPPDIIRMMDEARAAGTDTDVSFLRALEARMEEWLDGIREDIRPLVDEPWTREDRDSERARALREALHALMAAVPGLRRMTRTDKEQRNVRDALKREGRLDKNDHDENENIGLTLAWIDLHRKASWKRPFMLKGKDGQWRTTTERVRDLLRKPGATDAIQAPPGVLWPEKRGDRKGKALSLDHEGDADGSSTLGESIAGQGEDHGTEAAEALRNLRDLLDSRLGDHPPLREVAEAALQFPERTDLMTQAAAVLTNLVDLLDSYRDDRGFQAALAYEWGRGGHRKPKAWGAGEIATAYGVSENVVYKAGERARALLQERGLRAAG